MNISNARMVCIDLVPREDGLGFIEIPIEAIVDGEVVSVNTKVVPIIQKEQ